MANWFTDTFLTSFGRCSHKRISEKQYNVFDRNLRGFQYKDKSEGNTEIVEYHYNNVAIIVQNSIAGYGKGWHEYYVTIKSIGGK